MPSNKNKANILTLADFYAGRGAGEHWGSRWPGWLTGLLAEHGRARCTIGIVAETCATQPGVSVDDIIIRPAISSAPGIHHHSARDPARSGIIE